MGREGSKVLNIFPIVLVPNRHGKGGLISISDKVRKCELFFFDGFPKLFDLIRGQSGFNSRDRIPGFPRSGAVGRQLCSQRWLWWGPVWFPPGPACSTSTCRNCPTLRSDCTCPPSISVSSASHTSGVMCLLQATGWRT